jgi:hypothetical protein
VRDLTSEQSEQDLKRTFEKGIDKDTFVNFVVEYLSSQPVKVENSTSPPSKVENSVGNSKVEISKVEISNDEKMKFVRLGQKQQAILEDIKSSQSVCNPKPMSGKYQDPVTTEDVINLRAELNNAFSGIGCIMNLINFLNEKYNFKPAKGKAKGNALKTSILNQFQEEMAHQKCGNYRRQRQEKEKRAQE